MTNKYPVKKYPIVGACGLDCGLCQRFHTEGTSRCPGCCGENFREKHPSCGFITCCVKEKNLETCAGCADWEGCGRLGRSLDASERVDSFISYRPLAGNLESIRKNGIDAFARLELEKLEFLRYLIKNYDDGRSRGFFCLSCQLVPLDSLKEVLANEETSITGTADIKEKARTVRAAISGLADRLGISLKLKKQQTS